MRPALWNELRRSMARFDAFVSYSHAADGRLAPALQEGLQQFAKKWYRRRALRLFRDQTNLSANPGLWTSIQQALGDSRFFILLASPTAAESEWVAREVDAWRHKSPMDTLLLAVTDGHVEWDAARGDFNWESSTAVPRSLVGAYQEEPLFVDLRWAHAAEDLSLKNPRFADHVATLAARLHGRNKDDLIGEEVRQRRRFVAAASFVTAALAVLLVVATTLYFVAEQRRVEAERQRAEAERRGRVSLAQALTSDAMRQQEVHHRDDIAMLLVAEAFRLNEESRGDRLSQIDQALRRILSSAAFSTLLSDGPASLTSVTVNAGARLLAAGGEFNNEGHIRLWDLRTRAEAGSIATETEGVMALDFAGEGRLAAGTRDGRLMVWDVRNAAAPSRICSASVSASQIRSVSAFPERGVVGAASDDGALVLMRGTDCGITQRIGPFDGIAWSIDFATATPILAAGFADGVVRLWRVGNSAAEKYATFRASDAVHAVAIDPSGARVAVGTNGDPSAVEMWEIAPGTPRMLWARTRSSDVISLAFGPDGRYLAVGMGDGSLYRLDLSGSPVGESRLPDQGLGVVSLAVDPVRHLLASASRDGSLRIASLGAPLGRPTVLGSLSPSEQVMAIGLSGNARLLASADGHTGTVRMWDPIAAVPRLPPLRYGSADGSSQMASVAVSPDGNLVAAGTSDLMDGDNTVLLWRLSQDPPGLTKVPAHSPVRVLAFSGNGALLAAATEAHNHVTVWSLAPDLSARRVGASSPAVGLCFDPSEPRLVLALQDQSLHAWNAGAHPQDSSTLLVRNAGPLTVVACLGQSGTIATGDRQGRIRLWDRRGSLLRELRGQGSWVTALATDQRSALLVSGDRAGNMRVWTLARPNDPPVEIPSSLEYISSLAFDPSGEWVVAAGEARVLKIDLTATLIRKAESRLWRNLTLGEWRRFVGDAQPPRATFGGLPPPR